jgi:formylglycine-generating enzyme required for sulfatase activity
MIRMARPRHILLIIGVLSCLASCERTGERAPSRAAVPKPAAAASATAPKPAPAVKRREAPRWQSSLPAIQPAEVDATLRQADAALARGQLERGNSPGPGALELYLAVLDVAPGQPRAAEGVQKVLDALLERGLLAMRAGRVEDAERVEEIALAVMPAHADLAQYQRQLRQARVAQQALQRGEQSARAGDITLPAGSSALDHLRQAREAFADFAPIAAASKRWNRVLLQRAWRAAQKEDFADADSWLLESERLAPASAEARIERLRILELRQARSEAAFAAGNAAVDALRLERAELALAHATRIAAQPAQVEQLRQRIHLARHYGPFQPGQAFAEKLASGGKAPEMVVIPYGGFQMGAAESDPQQQGNELPAHRVEFRRGFAIARNETTVADFGRFVAATRFRTAATVAGHSTVYDEKGGAFAEHEGVDWRRDHVGRIASPALPVVHITLADALAYAQWLSRQTGARYRLPSEAEFEYVLRAGKGSIYPWGDQPPASIVGNLAGDGDLSTVARHWGNAISGYRDAFWGPAPVRNFPVEPFGTFDMVGNVSEWTLDCWHDSYQRAPIDGSAWVNPGCPTRTVRGASWGSSLEQVRSAYRLPMEPTASTARLGFRVVRVL